MDVCSVFHSVPSPPWECIFALPLIQLRIWRDVPTQAAARAPFPRCSCMALPKAALGRVLYQRVATEEKGASLSWDHWGDWLFPSLQLHAAVSFSGFIFSSFALEPADRQSFRSFLKEFLYHRPTSALRWGGKSYRSLQREGWASVDPSLGREIGRGILMRWMKGSGVGQEQCRSWATWRGSEGLGAVKCWNWWCFASTPRHSPTSLGWETDWPVPSSSALLNSFPTKGRSCPCCILGTALGLRRVLKRGWPFCGWNNRGPNQTRRC